MAYELFNYVDVFAIDSEDRAQKWERAKRGDLDHYRKRYNNTSVFCTVQRFGLPKETPDEAHISPFYLDFDGTRAGMENVEGIRRSKLDASRVLEYLPKIAVPLEAVRCFFSGAKGFHIEVPAELFGATPRSNLNEIWKQFALELKSKLGLESLDDTVYSQRRQWRLVNSVHKTTNLHKIPLTPDELKNWTVEQIMETAKGERPAFAEDELSPVEELQEKFGELLLLAAEAPSRESSGAKPAFSSLEKGFLPVCMQHILQNFYGKPGDGNRARIVLASYWKDAGLSEEETESKLVEWMQEVPESLRGKDREEKARRDSAISTVRATYQRNYHFGCQFIRALSTPDKVVPCIYSACPLDTDEPDTTTLQLHLAEASNAVYTGRPVRVRGLVAGLLETPYIVPRKVQLKCINMGCKVWKECPIGTANAERSLIVELTARNREIVEFCGSNDSKRVGILRRVVPTPCKGEFVKTDEIDRTNIEELLLVPAAERIHVSVSENGAHALDDRGYEYVQRKVYYVGFGIRSNQHYDIEAYVYNHPKTQEATLIGYAAQPFQDSIGQFKLTEGLIESFRKYFRPYGKQTSKEKLVQIVEDLTKGVTRIWERDEVLLLILMTYHSVTSFYFLGELQRRGWLEILILGDPGCGKTHLVRRIADHIGLGETISGETATRTGIVYAVDEVQHGRFLVWGDYVLNDRKLLIVDEADGISKEDLGEMSHSRSEGYVVVRRSKRGEANCRTRLIFLSNPRYGKAVNEFGFGVQAVKQFFEPPDVRRLDMAVLLEKGDVPISVLNLPRRVEENDETGIPGEILRRSVLWTWSRKPEQIVFEKDAENAILRLASELSTRYGGSDIPLVHPADHRIKLARLSISIAALLHSTGGGGNTHENIVVKPEHVYIVYQIQRKIFESAHFGYGMYCRTMAPQIEKLDTHRIWKGLVGEPDTESYNEPMVRLLRLYLGDDNKRLSEVQTLLDLDRNMAQRLLQQLGRIGFLRSRQEGYKKTPIFNQFLAECAQLGFLQVEQSDPFGALL